MKHVLILMVFALFTMVAFSTETQSKLDWQGPPGIEQCTLTNVNAQVVVNPIVSYDLADSQQQVDQTYIIVNFPENRVTLESEMPIAPVAYDRCLAISYNSDRSNEKVAVIAHQPANTIPGGNHYHCGKLNDQVYVLVLSLAEYRCNKFGQHSGGMQHHTGKMFAGQLSFFQNPYRNS